MRCILAPLVRWPNLVCHYIDYRLRWLDANGLQIIPYASWEVVSLEGQEVSLISFISPRIDATDFRFEIKAHY